MPGGGGSTTTTVNQTQLPQWVTDAAKSNVDLANTIASQKSTLPTSYNASMNPVTKQALSYFQSNLGAGTGNIGAAGDVYSTLADPTKLGANIQALENPYTDDVVNKSIADLMDTNKQLLMGNADAAAKSGAFGGTRQAVTDAVTNSQTIKNAGLLSSQLRSQGYTDATNAALSSLGTAGTGLLNTGQAQSQDVLSKFAGLLQGGQTQQAQDQADLDSQNKLLDAQHQQDIDNLNVRLAALGMSPYPSSSTSTANTTSSPDYATAGLGILSLLGGLFP